MRNLCTLLASLLILATWSCKKEKPQSDKDFKHQLDKGYFGNSHWDDDRYNHDHNEANKQSHVLGGKTHILLMFLQGTNYMLSYDTLVGNADSLIEENGSYLLDANKKTLTLIPKFIYMKSYKHETPMPTKAPYTFIIKELTKTKLYLDSPVQATITVITSEGVPDQQITTQYETIYFEGKYN